MIFIYIFTAVMVCINLGNSLESTQNQSPSEERYNFFDAELLQVFSRKETSNVLVSPISIKLVLGMLVEGAEGKTATEIRAALRLPEDEESRRKEFNTLSSVLQTTESPNILKVANRMFLSDRYLLDPDYGKTLREHYSGGVTSVKFQDPKEASHVINTWVGNHTSRLIPSIVNEDQISPDDKLMLASAVYFRGFWSRPFASERSTIRCFYSKDDKCTDSLMMMETGYFDYGYISRLDAKAIVLPYKGGNFSMLLLLPSKRDGVHLLIRDLVHVSLRSILSEVEEQEVLVQIPRFEISYNDDLVGSLRNVQISELFTPSANLSKLFVNRLESASVSHVYHSAKITVNEEGSEAAAATGAMFVPLMGGTTTSFVANRPFLFFVLSSTKNSVLFAGKVVSPKIPEGKKRAVSLNSRDEPFKNVQTLLQSAIPSSPRKGIKTNASQDTGNGTFPEWKTKQQPKFRSIKPPFGSPVRRGSLSYPGGHSETQNSKKRSKTVQELSKNRKRQEPPTDEWRRHVLFFT